MDPYPAVVEHLRQYRDRLEHRATKQKWYELQQPQYAYAKFLREPKIVFPDIATGCRFALDNDGHFGANTVYFLPTANLELLGLLNSRMAYFFFKQTCAALEGPEEAYLRFFGQYLQEFPVCVDEIDRNQQFAELVDRAIGLHRQLETARTPEGKKASQRQIETTNRQIDRLVYALYGLTEQEIELVEQSAPGQ